MAAGRVNAHAVRGSVVVTVDPTTARELAEAFAAAYATCDELEQERPRWFDDVTALITAAAQAEVQSGDAPAPVMVPMYRPPPPALRLVGDPA